MNEIRAMAGLRARRFVKACLALALVAVATPAIATDLPPTGTLEILPLGVLGGLQEGALSAYLLRPVGGDGYVLLDAGTLMSGLAAAAEKGAFGHPSAHSTPLSQAHDVLTRRIDAVLLSHAHLDHVGGLAIGAPDDVARPVYGLASTLDSLSASIFNWKTWPNFTDRGISPLGQYTLVPLEPTATGETLRPLPSTPFDVGVWPLSHGGITSTAFLLRHRNRSVLYLGDTGPDAVEKRDRLATLWTAVAKPIREGELAAIMIEVSYPDGRTDDELFGHLTPAWLLTELRALASRIDPDHLERALTGLTVVITHIKPGLKGEDTREQIRTALDPGKALGVEFVFPEVGIPIVR